MLEGEDDQDVTDDTTDQDGADPGAGDDDQNDGASAGDDDGAGSDDDAAAAAAAADADAGEGEGDGDGAGDDEGAEPKKTKQVPWFQKRIDTVTGEKHNAERRADAAEKELERLRGADGDDTGDAGDGASAPTDPAIIDELATRKAEQITQQKEFDSGCDAAFTAGTEKYDDFEDSLGTFKALGGLMPDVVEEILAATDEPEDVLYQLGKDPDAAQRILSMTGPKRIAEFVKLAMPKAAPQKQVSKAGAPITPISGKTNKDFDFADDAADDDEWQRRRQKHVDEIGIR